MDSDEDGHSIDYSLLRTAIDSMGIYPQSINGVERTEWQDGWNSALIRIEERHEAFVSWYQSLPEATRSMYKELLTSDSTFHLDVKKDGQVCMLYNTSDLFAWGYSCADIIEDDAHLAKIYDAWKKKGHLGVLAWQCKHENQKPQKPMEDWMRNEGVWDDEMEALPQNEYDNRNRA